jgi:hypothetical protein
VEAAWQWTEALDVVGEGTVRLLDVTCGSPSCSKVATLTAPKPLVDEQGVLIPAASQKQQETLATCAVTITLHKDAQDT